MTRKGSERGQDATAQLAFLSENAASIGKSLALPWATMRESSLPSSFNMTVRPLTQNNIASVKNLLTGDNPSRLSRLEALRQYNSDTLAQSDTVAIVLEGRSPSTKTPEGSTVSYTEGYLGDMVEASRMIHVLRNAGKKVVVFTSNPDLFAGTPDRSVSVIGIPADIEPTPFHPFGNLDLIEFMYGTISSQGIGQADKVSYLTPLNGSTPVLYKIEKPNGRAQITDSSKKALSNSLLNAVKSRYGPITDSIWYKLGVHQLQALQVMSHLIGIGGAENWTEFPRPYVHPDISARTAAEYVVNHYDCFPDGFSAPILIHPGVASNNQKVAKKFLPEKSWETVIDKIAEHNGHIPPRPVLFFRPTDSFQAAMTDRLASYASLQGLRTIVLPIGEIETYHKWTLGAFAAFLEKLARKKGLIVGMDSMPAAHLAPGLGINAVVPFSYWYPPNFYGPGPEAQSIVIMPPNPIASSSPDYLPGSTANINPDVIGRAIVGLIDR